MNGVSILIFTKDNAKELDLFLSSFTKINTHEAIEFIILDFNSHDRIQEIVSHYSSIVFIRFINIGTHYHIYESVGIGIGKAAHEHILILDLQIEQYSINFLSYALNNLQSSNIKAVAFHTSNACDKNTKSVQQVIWVGLLFNIALFNNKKFVIFNENRHSINNLLSDIAGYVGFEKIIFYDLKRRIQYRAKNINSLISQNNYVEFKKKSSNLRSPLVSVIMTAYNSEKTIKKSIDSILNQKYKHIELLIIDDNSSDQTYNIAKDYALENRNIQVYSNSKNRGTYWSKNFGITKSKGELITFQDSDDISLENRILLQVNEFIKNDNIYYCICNQIRVDENGIQVSASKICYFALMFRKDKIIENIGYFDSVRVSADSEFYERLKLVFPESRSHIKDNLCVTSYREGSLTLCSQKSLRIDFKNESPSLPPDRVEYISSFQKWHADIQNKESSPYMPFPLGQRRFPAPESMKIDNVLIKQIVCSVASIPSRINNLENTVECMLPQVDSFYVYLNNYQEIPYFLKHPKIKVALSQDHGDLADNGKFFFSDQINDCIHLAIDDDIFYPNNYVQKMCISLQKYNYKAIVGVHGVLLAEPMLSFYKNRKVYHFSAGLNRDEFVNLLGTGTICYHTSTICLSHKNFTTTRMADLWVALQSKKNQISMVSICRRNNWLKQQIIEGESSIYLDLTKHDTIQTEIAKKHGPWGSEGLVRPKKIIKEFGHGSIDNMKKYDMALPKIDSESKTLTLVQPNISKLNILIIGRFNTWKKGGIHKSCKLIADSLSNFGHNIQTSDTLEPLPIIDNKTDIAWIYPGDPNRPDYNTVDQKVRTLQKMGIPVVVNFSHIQKEERSRWIVDQIKKYNFKNKFPPVFCAVFSHSCFSDPLFKDITDYILFVPKTIHAEVCDSIPSFHKREGICFGDAAKLFNPDIIGGDIEPWIEACAKKLPNINLYAYKQYSGEKIHSRFTFVPYMKFGFNNWLAKCKLFVCLNQHSTFEMVPCEAQANGTPVLYRNMPQSLNEYIGLTGIYFSTPDELAEMCYWLYFNFNKWERYSRLSLKNYEVKKIEACCVSIESSLKMAIFKSRRKSGR